MSSVLDSEKQPRKGSGQSSTSIRSRLNDQLNKLQTKHNAEIELLEDLKLFSRQRSVLEKQYSEGLHRLVSQYIGKRELQPPPKLLGYERHNNRGLIEVWKALLEKTEDLSKRRLTMSELLVTQVSDVAKQQKRIKEANFKKLIDICQKMNSELLDSTKELLSCKKLYCELEKVSEEARAKYNEAETRLKKRDLKFFESVSSLEKNHNKASERLKLCQKRTTANRNDYILTIVTTNTHMRRHETRDLPQIMQGLDGELYDKVRNAYSLYAQIELDSAQFVKAEFEDLAEQACLVNREYVLECYLHVHPVLREVQECRFEPFGQDTVTAISRDHGAEIFLDKDARKWANKLTKDQMSIESLQKQVKGLQSVTSAYTKNPEFGTSDAQTEAFQNIDSLLEDIRQLEVQTIKAEARLACLREAGIDVNKWLQKAESNHKQNDKTNELTPSSITYGRVSQLSLPFSVGSSQDFDVETSSVSSAQLGADDTASMGSGISDPQLKYCTVLYSYSAQREDELAIVEGEELEELEWDDGDGWCKGRNKSGQEGYFPQSYVQPTSRPSSPGPGLGGMTAPSVVLDVTTPTQAVPVPKTNGAAGGVLLKSVYEYTAQFPEELSFPEGVLIQLLRTDENGVDDGWWEGSYQGKVGVFPSLVVETVGDETVSPGLNSTLVRPPPPESPPPLPPDYPPPPISPQGANGVGPKAVVLPDTPVNVSTGNRLRSWKMDSFDSDLDDGSLV